MYNKIMNMYKIILKYYINIILYVTLDHKTSQ